MMVLPEQVISTATEAITATAHFSRADPDWKQWVGILITFLLEMDILRAEIA